MYVSVKYTINIIINIRRAFFERIDCRNKHKNVNRGLFI